MSLAETIKELKEQIAEEDKKDAEEKPQEDSKGQEQAEKKPEETRADADSKSKEKPEEAEKPAEEVKPEEKAAEKPDDLAFQRLRRENAAAKKRAETAEAEAADAKAKLAARETTKTEEAVTEAPPVDPEIEEIKHDRRLKNAEREFMDLENKFATSTPDYHDVSREYAIALAQSIKIQNPRMSNSEVGEETKKSLLIKASNWMNKGFDPIEELYNEAKELGFKGDTFKKQPEKPKEEEKEVEIKPDMAKLAANRKKSTGMTGSSGESKGQLTRQAAADFTVAEWARLPKEEKRRLMYE